MAALPKRIIKETERLIAEPYDETPFKYASVLHLSRPIVSSFEEKLLQPSR